MNVTVAPLYATHVLSMASNAPTAEKEMTTDWPILYFGTCASTQGGGATFGLSATGSFGRDPGLV
jgi:hypothetical protein